MKEDIDSTGNREMPTTICRAKRDRSTIQDQVYMLDYIDNDIRCGIMNGTIPSTVADSGATSQRQNRRRSMHTHWHSIEQGLHPTRWTSVICIRNGTKYPFKLRAPGATDMHILPDITRNSLIRTVKLANADYITIFDKEQINI